MIEILQTAQPSIFLKPPLHMPYITHTYHNQASQFQTWSFTKDSVLPLQPLRWFILLRKIPKQIQNNMNQFVSLY